MDVTQIQGLIGDANIKKTLILIFSAVVCIFVFFLIYRGDGKPSIRQFFSKYKKKEYLNSKAEQVFYQELKGAIGGSYNIQCKVRLADVVEAKSRKHFLKISAKHLDYVITGKDSAILMAVELDDSSHGTNGTRESRRSDVVKDRVMRDAGVKLIRVKCRGKYYKKSDFKEIINSL